MPKESFESPKHFFHKLLIDSYRTKSVGGQSPLDIPGRTMLKSFIAAIIISIIVGNLFMFLLQYSIQYSLSNIYHDEPKPENISKDTAFIYRAIVGELLPQIANRIESADPALKKSINENFKKGGITIEAIALLAGGQEIKKTTAVLERKVIGEFSRSGFLLWLIPVFEPESADKIVDEVLGLQKNYSEQPGQYGSLSWKRFIAVSAIQNIRDKLDNSITEPRRLLLAISGYIQWLTFIAAVWCLILLLALKLPWAKLQTQLVVEKKLPWHHNEGLNIWDIQASDKYFSLLDEKQHYPKMFIPVRLIKDLLNTKSVDKSASSYEIIRARIEAYRDSVDIGEYEIINFLMWAAPTFGFIGTIFGIISAMENASAIFTAAPPIDQSIALDKVSSNLGTAFDTTFVALIWLIPMSFYLAKTRKREANLFEELEFESIRNLPVQIEQGTEQENKNR